MSYFYEEVFNQLKEDLVSYGKPLTPPKFLVDAQLPMKLSQLLRSKGYDSIHTLDLPEKNKTKDSDLKELALREDRILITKYDDFLQSFLIQKKPSRLLLIKTGNISNTQLLAIFESGIDVMAMLLTRHSMLEINKAEIIVHD